MKVNTTLDPIMRDMERISNEHKNMLRAMHILSCIRIVIKSSASNQNMIWWVPSLTKKYGEENLGLER